MGEEMDEQELERLLNTMRVYEEFDDCRHLVEEVFDFSRQNKIRYFHVEVALELAYGEYLEKKDALRKGRGYEDRLRELKVEAITGARDYVSDMVHGRRSR